MKHLRGLQVMRIHKNALRLKGNRAVPNQNTKQLVKKLLPGMLPLVVFVVVDEIWGTRIGLWVAIAFGALEMSIIFMKEKRFDRFVLLDTLLLAALGALSLALENEAFFKLKPALFGLILCAVLGISAFSPRNLLLGMSRRYMGELVNNEQFDIIMRQKSRTLFFLFLAHTMLVFYAAFYMSKEAWIFITTILFYALFGAYLLVELLRVHIVRRHTKAIEWLPIVDQQGHITGKASRTQCHSDKNLLHPVVHLHVFDSKGRLFLQKRPDNKDIQPGKWDTAVGGHVSFGETIEEALIREASEEIGLKPERFALVDRYIWESDRERELVFMFATISDTVTPDENELAGGAFFEAAPLDKLIKSGACTPNFVHERDKIEQKRHAIMKVLTNPSK